MGRLCLRASKWERRCFFLLSGDHSPEVVQVVLKRKALYGDAFYSFCWVLMLANSLLMLLMLSLQQ